MNLADDIKNSLEANSISRLTQKELKKLLPPSKAKLKWMVNNDKWDLIGKIFKFTPVFHFTSGHFIDWRSVPEKVLNILKSPSKNSRHVPPPKKKPKGPAQLKKQLWPTRKTLKIAMDAAGNGKRLALAVRLPIRQRLYEQQEGKCYFCGVFVPNDDLPNKSLDHLTPISKGGTNEDSNLKFTCAKCNHDKGSMTEAQFRASKLFVKRTKIEPLKT